MHDLLTAKELKPGFVFEGERIPLINPQRGIFKPQQMRFLLSIKTVFPRPGTKIWYDGQRDVHRQIFEGDETVDYAFMGANPALLHGPEQIADLPVPVAESPGAVRIGHPERSHLVEYLAPNSVFNSLPRQRSSPHLRPDDRLVTIDRVLHHASLGVA